MADLPRAPPSTPPSQGGKGNGGPSRTPGRSQQSHQSSPYHRHGPRRTEGLCCFAPYSLSDNAREYLYVEAPFSGDIEACKTTSHLLKQGDWQQNSFVAGGEYMKPFEYISFGQGHLRHSITGAKMPAIPWGQAGTPFAACAGKAAMRKLIFSAGHARKMSNEIRQSCPGFEALPLLSGPANLAFPHAHITVYQVDFETAADAFTVFAGPADYKLQVHLRNTFNTSRVKLSTEAFPARWVSTTPRGAPADSGAFHEFFSDWSVTIDNVYATSSTGEPWQYPVVES